jgi:hypothetical protein
MAEKPFKRIVRSRGARKNLKDIRGKPYPVTEEDLARRLPQEDGPPPMPIVLPELSAEPEVAGTAAPSGDGNSADASGPVIAESGAPPAAEG